MDLSRTSARVRALADRVRRLVVLRSRIQRSCPSSFEFPMAGGGRSMKRPKNACTITRDLYDAVLFDLDGVITDTANLHAACWKRMFDEYLQNRASATGELFRSFDPARAY